MLHHELIFLKSYDKNVIIRYSSTGQARPNRLDLSLVRKQFNMVRVGSRRFIMFSGRAEHFFNVRQYLISMYYIIYVDR